METTNNTISGMNVTNAVNAMIEGAMLSYMNGYVKLRKRGERFILSVSEWQGDVLHKIEYKPMYRDRIEKIISVALKMLKNAEIKK